MTLPYADRELVLDTNVLVHILRRDEFGQRLIRLFALDRREFQPIISVVTVGELRSLTTQWKWNAEKVTRLDERISRLNVIDVYYEGGSLIEAYASVDTFSRSRSPAVTMGKNDLWIAATTRIWKAVLVTCDRDFVHLAPDVIDVEYVDPPRPSR